MADVIVTLIGADRPGLVEAVADRIKAHEGNWLESRLVRLAGQFAGVLRVELPAESVKPLTGALRDLASEGLDVTVRPAGAAKLEAAAHVMMLAVVGYDYPGIVRNIAQVLADAGVNIEELDTHRSDAPMAGGSLFHAHALLRVPETVDVDRLRRDIETIAHDLMVDLEPEKETL